MYVKVKKSFTNPPHPIPPNSLYLPLFNLLLLLLLIFLYFSNPFSPKISLCSVSIWRTHYITAPHADESLSVMNPWPSLATFPDPSLSSLCEFSPLFFPPISLHTPISLSHPSQNTCGKTTQRNCG